MELREDIREAKDLLRAILRTGETSAAGGFAGSWAVLYKRLVDAEVKPELANELLQQVKNAKADGEARIEKRFVSVLGERFAVSGPITLKNEGPTIAAFVGPTGSGKTTTIAKIAAHYALSAKKNVSIITADTYRIAAIEQIRAFADIVGISLQILFSPAEVRDALTACENDDLVLVDTAGRSRRNSVHMKELGEFVTALKPHEIHCVLSAGTKDSDLRQTIRRFGTCGVNRLLFTKLDETERVGNIYNISAESGIPVSYFTVGQSVPDDIELAQPSRFVQKLWEGGSV
jgi:flagellar biosynthesis protein FlhF